MNKDGSRRSLKSFALSQKECDSMQTTLGRTFKKATSEPTIQTLDADSKASFFGAVSGEFAK